MHAAGNAVVVGLFIAGWFLRRPDPLVPPMLAIILSFIGVGLALVTGWLGGELVDRLGVGVDDGAHLDSPSSLSHLPARHGAGRDRRKHAYRRLNLREEAVMSQRTPPLNFAAFIAAMSLAALSGCYGIAPPPAGQKRRWPATTALTLPPWHCPRAPHRAGRDRPHLPDRHHVRRPRAGVHR